MSCPYRPHPEMCGQSRCIAHAQSQEPGAVAGACFAFHLQRAGTFRQCDPGVEGLEFRQRA